MLNKLYSECDNIVIHGTPTPGIQVLDNQNTQKQKQKQCTHDLRPHTCSSIALHAAFHVCFTVYQTIFLDRFMCSTSGTVHIRLHFPKFGGSAASASYFHLQEYTILCAFPQAGTGTEIITNRCLRGCNVLIAFLQAMQSKYCIPANGDL